MEIWDIYAILIRSKWSNYMAKKNLQETGSLAEPSVISKNKKTEHES